MGNQKSSKLETLAMSYSKEDDGSDLDAASFIALRNALADLVANAVKIPDPTMAGTTDGYRVPMDDIFAAHRALKLAGVKS